MTKSTTKYQRFLLLCIFVSLLQACSGDEKKTGNGNFAETEIEPTLEATNPLLKLLAPTETGVDFQNTITENLFVVFGLFSEESEDQLMLF